MKESQEQKESDQKIIDEIMQSDDVKAHCEFMERFDQAMTMAFLEYKRMPIIEKMDPEERVFKLRKPLPTEKTISLKQFKQKYKGHRSFGRVVHLLEQGEAEREAEKNKNKEAKFKKTY